MAKVSPYHLLQLFFDCHNYLPLQKDLVKLEKQTGLKSSEITRWFTDKIQQVNEAKYSDTFNGIPEFADESSSMVKCEFTDKKMTLTTQVLYTRSLLSGISTTASLQVSKNIQPPCIYELFIKCKLN